MDEALTDYYCPNCAAEQQMRTLTVDIDAVRDIISDIRNGEHLLWGAQTRLSNAELLGSLLPEAKEQPIWWDRYSQRWVGSENE